MNWKILIGVCVGIVVLLAILVFQINHKETEKIEEGIWKPSPGLSWQWQLEGELNLSYDVDVYDVDLFKISKKEIDGLHKRGKRVICYFSAGSWEEFREDASEFPQEVLGKRLKGWEDERWLNVAEYEKFSEIMAKRMDLAKEKGCDGVEVDNIDGYENENGFGFGYDEQMNYNLWLAEEVHKRGLAIGLKNDLNQIEELVNVYDFAINEQCFEFDECEKLLPFVENGKAVFGVEYNLEKEEFCDKAKEMNFSWLKMDLDLSGGRDSC